MEGLKKLENVEKIIELMQSHGIVTSSSNANSLRFLADLTLLLVSPCHELDVDAKCELIIDHVPKVCIGF
ncbi:hypothetical protein RND71_014854 [Anisodus tanguticus]|uniref:Uncharacterized protein n=1 Tax=Anisodus tanguticus TaxID=243964 RepID=A0AAE1S9X8_9SOLA|nr:hypothetical protein RND71_014854 [Anisodus tanguticus]